jgi:transcriptional regulator with XRE-family HTH domain
MRKIRYISDIQDSENIGALIRESRRAKGLKLRDVARRSGVSESAISKYEKGTRIPNYESLRKILDALDIDIVLVNN